MPPRPHSSPKGAPARWGDNRTTLVAAAGAGVVVLAGVVAWILLGGGGGAGAADARAALEAAGCTLQTAPAVPGVHSVASAEGTSDQWNTDPPTSGPHFGTPVIWGSYTTPVNPAQLVHNLEHGGVFIQFGDKVPDATIAVLQAFYRNHERGTVLAQYPKLGSQIALGAWVTTSASNPEDGTGYVARCSAFDEPAFSAFFDAFQFSGPERFPADTLLPGGT